MAKTARWLAAAVCSGDAVTRAARDIMDLGLEIGTGMLAYGASVAATTRASWKAMQGRGAAETQVNVTSDSITVTVRQEVDTDPVTAVRVVPVGYHDFTRITQIEQIADASGLSIAEATSRLRRLRATPSKWQVWDVSIGYGVIAGSVAMMLGASWIIGVFGLAAGACIHRLQLWLGQRRVSTFFQQAIGGAVAAAVAALVAVVKETGWLPLLADVSPGLIVIGNVISMLAGLAILGAAEDAISGFYVTGVAHALQAIVITVGLVIGVSVVIGVGVLVGVPIGHQSLSGPQLPAADTIFWGGMVAVGYGFASRASRRAIVAAGVIGAVAWGLLLALVTLGWPGLAASGLSAVFVGAGAGTAAQALKVQLDSISTSAIVPLLPGLATYEGLRSLALGAGLMGQDALVDAAAIAVALAAGAAAGAGVVRPLARPLGGLRLRRRRR